MYRPPSGPGAESTRESTDARPRPARIRQAWEAPTRRDLLVTYALVAAVPLSLWVVAQPLLGALAVAAAAGLVVVARRVARLARCLSTCRQLTVDLGRDVRITVTRGRPCEPS